MYDYIISKLILNTFLSSEKISIIDCGARGGSLSDWDSLGKYIVLYGFDPDEAECTRLNEMANSKGYKHFYFPFCLAGKNEYNRKFYITNNLSSCSLYQPNEKRIKRFRSSAFGKPMPTQNAVGLKEIIEINTICLDSWSKNNNITDIDFIKLDIQGAELEVLTGGSALLQTVLGLNVEVWFIPVYIGQPLFCDIDIFLRSHNFDFFSMYIYTAGQFSGRMVSPIVFDKVNTFWEQRYAGQLVTADVLYLKDPIHLESPDTNTIKLLKLICIAEMCNQVEYAFELLVYMREIFKLNGYNKEAELIEEIFNQSAKAYIA